MRVRCPVAILVSTAMTAAALSLAACGPGKELYSNRSTYVPSANSTATTPPATAAPVKLFDLGNVYGVAPGAKAPTFSLDRPATVTEIMTYHYVVGGGPTPGTIALKSQDGRTFGPWSTTGLDGQGAVKNAYWDAKPNVQLPAGAYTVVDSDPSTWSTNERANGLGFVTVLGTYTK